VNIVTSNSTERPIEKAITASRIRVPPRADAFDL